MIRRRDSGPPDKVAGPHTKGPANAEGSPTATSTAILNDAGPRTWLSQLHRRREASWRLIPVACGHADPWPRCTEPPLTDVALDGWRDAACHIIEVGCIPLVPIQVRRALWRRPADRKFAELLHELCGGAVA